MKVVNWNPVLDAMLVVQLINAIDGPEAAEISAVEYALKNGILPMHAWSDCANVVEAYRRGRRYCCSNDHPQAEHWRRVFIILDDHAVDAYNMMTISKIKAHCTELNYTSYGMSLLQFYGNKWADRERRSPLTGDGNGTCPYPCQNRRYRGGTQIPCTMDR